MGDLSDIEIIQNFLEEHRFVPDGIEAVLSDDPAPEGFQIYHLVAPFDTGGGWWSINEILNALYWEDTESFNVRDVLLDLQSAGLAESYESRGEILWRSTKTD